MTNAIKFTPLGGAVHVIAVRKSAEVQITVSDTGEGIDPDFLPHVFEPFRQAENPRTRVHGGLGLGLSIVRYIVEAHGGSVSVKSEGRGRGTQFIVSLPIAAVIPIDEAPEHPKEQLPAPSLDPTLLSGVRVLVLDDDKDGRALIRAALMRAGAIVEACDSGSRALAQLEHERPDVVVTDIAMPGMDGYAFTRAVRERPNLADLKIVALSAFPIDSQSAETVRFDARLLKPIDPFALVEAVAAAIGKRRS